MPSLPRSKVIALDAATGKLLWKFDSLIQGTGPDRGIAYWTDGKEKRLLAGVMNFVYAIDPATGKVNRQLRKERKNRPARESRTRPRASVRGSYQPWGHLQRFADRWRTEPGRHCLHLRATFTPTTCVQAHCDGRSTPFSTPGEFRLRDLAQRRMEVRWAQQTTGLAWPSIGSAALCMFPTGSAAPDFYGITRIGDDLFADTLLASDAQPVRGIWHFQGVQSRLWDRDFPAAPILFLRSTEGENDFPRWPRLQTGVSFTSLTESTACPCSQSKTGLTRQVQPWRSRFSNAAYPLIPEPFARQIVTEDTLTNRTPEAQ